MKIQNALDENRMLILGAEILLGFEFTAAFHEGFKHLSIASQNLNLGAWALMLLTVALLISPAVFHQLTEKGQDSVALHRFATHVIGNGSSSLRARAWRERLPPSGSGQRHHNGPSFWGDGNSPRARFLVWTRAAATQTQRIATNGESESGHTRFHDKIRQVLTEARVNIPANQALLGFQLAIILQIGFRELAPWLKWIHLARQSFINRSKYSLTADPSGLSPCRRARGGNGTFLPRGPRHGSLFLTASGRGYLWRLCPRGL
jgi:hypothetical protein